MLNFLKFRLEAEISPRGSWHSLEKPIGHETERMRHQAGHFQIRIHQDRDQLPNFSKAIWTKDGLEVVRVSVSTFPWRHRPQQLGNGGIGEEFRTDLFVAWSLAGPRRWRRTTCRPHWSAYACVCSLHLCNLIFEIQLIFNWQLSEQGIRWPVSHDHIAG